ncbi:MAG TPA: ATP-binding protein [Sphingobacteriaceae bacterium]
MEAAFQWISKSGPSPAGKALPRGFVRATLVLSLAPSLLVVLVTAGHSGSPAHPAVPNVLLDAGRGFLFTGPVFYNLWMIFGIASAMIISCLSFADYYVRKEISTPVIGSALLCTALYDMFYFVLYSNQTASPGSFNDEIYQSWFISRVLHSALLVAGTAFYLGIRDKGARNAKQKHAQLYRIILFFILLLAAAIYLTGKDLNSVVRKDAFLTHPLALIPLVLYLLWTGLILPESVRRHPTIFTRMLLLSAIPAILAQGFMATHSHTFDSLFNMAYFLRALNYTIPLFGISISYMDTIRNEKKVIEQLDSEIKERIRGQQILEKREALLASAEQIAGLGSWEFDTESGEVKWSDQMYGIFGFRVQQVQPSIQLQEKLTAPEFRETVRKAILVAIRKKRSYSLEYQIVRPGGKRRFVLAQGRYISNGNKLVGTLLDITELKEANLKLSRNEALLRLKVEELNRSNTELEQFAYVASHDLQEPLRKIRAFGERLEHTLGTGLPPDGRDYLDRMKNAAERMQTLIDDLLTYSRLTRIGGGYETLPLPGVLRNVTANLEYAIERGNARLHIDARHAVDAVPGQLEQLFQNLISNSLKFARTGTEPEITIRSEVIRGSDAGPHLAADREYCRITVSDNGIGFDARYSEKIFVLFQRLHSRSEYPGTGMGLAICKKIVENHNGWITASGQEGMGASFTLLLPVNQ